MEMGQLSLLRRSFDDPLHQREPSRARQSSRPLVSWTANAGSQWRVANLFGEGRMAAWFHPRCAAIAAARHPQIIRNSV